MGRRMIRQVVRSAWLLWIALFGMGGGWAEGAAGELDGLREATYRSLDTIRAAKRRQLNGYLSHLQQRAGGVKNDSLLHRYFSIKKRYHQLRRRGAKPPAEFPQMIARLQENVRLHAIRQYSEFYDILFVDADGFVLSTLRHQKDYHRNLFIGDLARTALAKQLRRSPEESFVDYEFYAASGEAAAFFVEPHQSGNRRLGWFVLQAALNKINAIFARSEGVGVSGETLLVNRRHRLLTESMQLPDGGILTRKLARKNIEAKFAAREGHKRVIDYRGYPSLTSFAVQPVLGSEWLIIVKVDEDEVLTRHFRKNRSADRMKWAELLDSRPTLVSSGTWPEAPVMVDMNEYQLRRQEALMTFGVSTCTAVLITLPGQFACLGHAGVNDRMYGAGEVDLLGNMLHRITRFEICPYQLRSLQVVVVAPHQESLSGVVSQLTEAGLFLSQIRFLYRPNAESATLAYTPHNGRTTVRWRGMGGSESWQQAQSVDTLGECYRRAMEKP